MASGCSCGPSAAVGRSCAEASRALQNVAPEGGCVNIAVLPRSERVLSRFPRPERISNAAKVASPGDGRRAKAMTEEKKPFTVSDRRHFTAEGEKRSQAPEETPAAPPPSPAPKVEKAEEPERNAAPTPPTPAE